MSKGQFRVLVFLGVSILIALVVNIALMLSDSEGQAVQNERELILNGSRSRPSSESDSADHETDSANDGERIRQLGQGLGLSTDPKGGKREEQKRVIRHQPPPHFKTPIDELRWYENELSNTRKLKERLDGIYLAMKGSKSPPTPDIIRKLERERLEATDWLAELEIRVRSLRLESKKDDSN